LFICILIGFTRGKIHAKSHIIGSVACGATTAAKLRRLDETAGIIILERGDYVSFANCCFFITLGGEITDKQSLTL